ncbi:zinc finger protein 233-like [Artemia franciscana]|uniref:zinc finger protein 233-like n=1 Tax=Artemia franciscana TaxID=6661 RepID=UPI0032DB4C03
MDNLNTSTLYYCPVLNFAQQNLDEGLDHPSIMKYASDFFPYEDVIGAKKPLYSNCFPDEPIPRQFVIKSPSEVPSVLASAYSILTVKVNQCLDQLKSLAHLNSPTTSINSSLLSDSKGTNHKPSYAVVVKYPPPELRDPVSRKEKLDSFAGHDGHLSSRVSGLNLRENASLVASKNSSASGFSNSTALEFEAKSLKSQRTCLKSRLYSKKHRKLERHQRTDKGKKPFKCDLCEKAFSRAHDLKRHQRVHTVEKPVKCDVCDKMFSQAAYLNAHQRVHTGEKPFRCDICDKTFSQATNLNRHQREHTGEKQFKCGVCKKDFSRAHDLKRHQRVHTGEKPVKCDVCDKTFSQAAYLNAHQRVHTGEKPFRCDICDKTFSQATNLNRQQRAYG